MNNWYKQSIDEVLSVLESDCKTGLNTGQLNQNFEKYGPNELKEEKRKGFFAKLSAQFSDFLVLILIGAAAISFGVGAAKDGFVILAIVVINAFLGLYQEGKAEKALQALQRMSSPDAKVLRNNKLEEVSTSSLVPGDIVLLDAGDIIPADLRLIESSNLKVEEASLTGESLPVDKVSNTVFDDDMSLGDRTNMAYMSTSVTYGRGKGVVVNTGHSTEIGKIATMIQSYDDELTPLQKQLNQLGKYLGIATIIICIVVFAIGLLQNRGLLEMLMIAISLAVAAIPEGLPAIVTIVLALGMNKMVKKNAIVKKLLAVETLGSTTVICSDKTGTLTQNEMTVVKVFVDDGILDITGGGYEPTGNFNVNGESIDLTDTGDLETLLSISALTNDADLNHTSDGYKIIGDPTEGALLTLAGKGNIEKSIITKKYPRIEELPFDSDRKMMTTFHKNYIANKVVSFTKGAPDIIINKCTRISMGGNIIDFTPEIKEKTMNMNSRFSKDALRVLAFAYKEYSQLPKDISTNSNESDMTFVGLVGMIDPARPEAKKAIEKCKNAGIKTVMITGDYKETAFAIARDLGMATTIDESIMGEEIDKYSDEELMEVVNNIKVYARVSPEHKVRIVNALRQNGEVVAMTGDGVNDALALKKADIGISMGITGTDVAKNTSDLILTDDNFASIVSAVEEGRVIYNNIKKFVFFLLSCNIGEILLVFLSMLLNLPIPLQAIQLLWLNLVTDSFPALALGVERGDPDIMDIAPRDPKRPILDKGMIRGIALQSIAIAGTSLLAYRWGLMTYPEDIDKARTITFTTLILAELLRAFSSRSRKYTLFKIGFFTNKSLIYASLLSFGLLLGVLYIPFMNNIFYTFPLGIKDWQTILPYAFIPLVIGELSKIIFKNKN